MAPSKEMPALAAAVREKCGQGDIVVREILGQEEVVHQEVVAERAGRYWSGRREILVREILLSGREVGSSGRKSNVW